MKTPTTRHPAPRSEARAGKPFNPEQAWQAIRACEGAAQRIQSASDELGWAWTSLSAGLASGAPPNDLLRLRAWCNVLELRLKERVHELEDARPAVDRLWDSLLQSRRAQELFGRLLAKEAEDCGTETGFTNLARTALTLAAERRTVSRHKE